MWSWAPFSSLKKKYKKVKRDLHDQTKKLPTSVSCFQQCHSIPFRKLKVRMQTSSGFLLPLLLGTGSSHVALLRMCKVSVMMSEWVVGPPAAATISSPNGVYTIDANTLPFPSSYSLAHTVGFRYMLLNKKFQSEYYFTFTLWTKQHSQEDDLNWFGGSYSPSMEGQEWRSTEWIGWKSDRSRPRTT